MTHSDVGFCRCVKFFENLFLIIDNRERHISTDALICSQLFSSLCNTEVFWNMCPRCQPYLEFSNCFFLCDFYVPLSAWSFSNVNFISFTWNSVTTDSGILCFIWRFMFCKCTDFKVIFVLKTGLILLFLSILCILFDIIEYMASIVVL